MNFSTKIKNYIIKSKFYSAKNSLSKNIFLVTIEFLNADLIYFTHLLLPPILYIYSLSWILIINLLKNLRRRFPFIKFLHKKFLNLAHAQYEILMLYFWKNDVYSYIVGEKQASISVPELSKFYIVLYTLMYIIDNFLNATEQYIERFFIIFRNIFIKAIFSLPNSIYYKIFSRGFHFKGVKKPTIFKLYIFKFIIASRMHIVIYAFDLFCFYTAVFFKNLFSSLYEGRKTVFIFLFIFLLFNLIFKETFSVVYEFFLSFFDYDFIISKTIEDINFKKSMNDMFNAKTKYSFFFKSEYKQFYGGGELYKLYYVYLTIKTEFIKNIENYWKFFKAFPPYTVFFLNKFYFFKKKINRYDLKRKKYGENKKDRFARNRKENRYRKKTVYERDFQKKSYIVLNRFWKKYLWFFDDKIEGIYYYICDLIQFLIRDRTHFLKIEQTTYNKRKFISTPLIFRFIFGILFKIFWLLKKLIIAIFKKLLFKICFISAVIAALFYVAVNLWSKRKVNVKIEVKGNVFFDCTLEEFIINLILNFFLLIIFFYAISFIPAILHFYIFKVYKPFLVYLYRKIKRYLNL